MKNFKWLVFAFGSILTIITMRKMLVSLNLDSVIKRTLTRIKNDYGVDIAKNVERIYRLETRNFTSNQFKKTWSAGMMAFSENFPYGWNTINEICWSQTPDIKPIGVISFKENPGLEKGGGGIKPFIQFKNLNDAMYTLACFLEHYENNAGRWYTTNAEKQTTYINALNKIKLIYT